MQTRPVFMQQVVPELEANHGLHLWYRYLYLLNKPGDDYVGPHEGLRLIASARCLISSAKEGICRAPLTRSRMY